MLFIKSGKWTMIRNVIVVTTYEMNSIFWMSVESEGSQPHERYDDDDSNLNITMVLWTNQKQLTRTLKVDCYNQTSQWRIYGGNAGGFHPPPKAFFLWGKTISDAFFFAHSTNVEPFVVNSSNIIRSKKKKKITTIFSTLPPKKKKIRL